ncbi:protein translocase subunit SecF [bacterium]|nr:MAG: protein translocase subunit SecF [bacterium]
MDFIKPDINVDFVSRRRIALICSLVVALIGIGSLAVKGGPIYGIDFSGGTLVQVRFDRAPEVGEIRNALGEAGLGSSVIQSLGEDKVAIRLKSQEDQADSVSDDLFSILVDQFGQERVSLELVEMVGPQVGADMRRKGMLSILYAMVGILIYVTFRFQFRFALGAIAALVHDIMITVGVFSLFNKEFTLPVIAALLTIIGYSLNDTIVVYDRIRENIRRMPKEKLAVVVNNSINQTLSRTILTSGTTLLVVGCLFVLGGEVIHDFSFALIVGVLVGTYSSIYIASPILLLRGKGSAAARTSVRQG